MLAFTQSVLSIMKLSSERSRNLLKATHRDKGQWATKVTRVQSVPFSTWPNIKEIMAKHTHTHTYTQESRSRE